MFDYSSAQPLRGMMVERIGSSEEYKLINKYNLKSKIDRVKANGDVPTIAFDADDFTSRLDAIDLAARIAKPGDIVYITGKGEGITLEFYKVEYEWSDVEAVKRALANVPSGNLQTQLAGTINYKQQVY